MSDALVAVPAVETDDRDVFSPFRVAFFIAIHLGVFAVFWQTNWKAIAVAVLLHAVCGGIGICVAYHRLLTHRSFKTIKSLEYFMAVLGTLSMQGGPIEWVALHRKHHQFSDKNGDPHNANEGFWWSHVLWVLHIPTTAQWKVIRRRYTPDLEKQIFYRVLERIHYIGSAVLAVLLYWWGGWPFVVWGICVRLVTTYHITWFVNSASHMWGYKNFPINDLSTNNWWVALLSYGEGWHNNHHAFPSSARHGLRLWEFDASYWFIRGLKAIGLAWDVKIPSKEKMAAKMKRTLADGAEQARRVKQELVQGAEQLAEKLSPPAIEETA
jgi:stearoyl-CoA desaturase (delta-9 desaturase)